VDPGQVPVCQLNRFFEMENHAHAGSKNEWLGWLGGLLAAALVYFLVLKVPLPAVIISRFSPFTLLHFIGLVILFFLVFQIANRPLRTVSGLFLTALVFALPLAIRLSTGLSNATVLGGFIPYKDGYYYYNGANMLLNGLPITANGLQGAFRPLFPGLLSILLTMTGANLLAALAIMTALLGGSVYWAAAAIRGQHGPLPAALFFALTYAFIRPMIGDTLTEVPSLAFACLSLALLYGAARSHRFADAAWGGVMLVLAVSIRAGAFFMLPFLIIWLGWLFRGGKKFSWRMAIIFGLIFVAAFGAFNVLLPRLITEQSGATFGNFSWMLYGQAVGGAGFQYHLQALGTDDSAVVLQAALHKIREYPLGLMIGFYKAYRDFFTHNALGMFDLLSGGKAGWGWFFWSLCIAGLVYGLAHALARIREAVNGLMLASFLGILASIPFLPPVDGGNRFYSGSVPYLFALMAIHLPALRLSHAEEERPAAAPRRGSTACWMAGMITVLMIGGPAVILNLSPSAQISLPECAAGETPVAVQIRPGSFVDILPGEAPDCGISPIVCLSQFTKSGMDRANDDFYNTLVELGRNSTSGIRLWAGLDYGSLEYHFFILPLESGAQIPTGSFITGCAAKVATRFQNVLRIVAID
jgi:hypothetical protein